MNTNNKPKRWKLVYDPTNTYTGDFSDTEFQAGLKFLAWPENSIWRDRDTVRYFRIKNSQEALSIGSVTKWVKKVKGMADYEKPPVGMRQVYR